MNSISNNSSEMNTINTFVARQDEKQKFHWNSNEIFVFRPVEQQKYL